MDKVFTPVIGKDVIESLTIGMYEDSRFIFREYIQNSADQIDKAVRDGLLTLGEGEIHIHISPETKQILIEDNATGIPQEYVRPTLQNIAQSTKQRGVDKGFRGIGRLGGLAYCSKLIFETSFVGEPVKSILTWNAAELKRTINNRGEKDEAVAVIQSVTEFRSEKEKKEMHYFKVILEGVTNAELLEKDSIEEYLSMVAPLPFATKFIFRSKIEEELKKKNLQIDEYKVYLNSEQLFKGYSTYIKKDESQAPYDEVIDLVFFEEYSDNGKLLFWGWHSLSLKNQSMNEVNFSRGFRLRKANIQVGDEFTLLKIHRDKRFQFYFFGEVHAVDPDLIPNSRRDYFIENELFFEFENKLRQYFHTHIYRLCHSASDINTFIRKSEELKNLEESYKQKSANGFTDKAEQKEFQDQFERKREEAIKAQKKIEKIEQDAKDNERTPLNRILQKVMQPELKGIIEQAGISVDEKPKFRTDNLSSLNKDQRKFLGRVFSIIRNVLDANTAENLIQKIEEELK
jgi:hypothetical protein